MTLAAFYFMAWSSGARYFGVWPIFLIVPGVLSVIIKPSVDALAEFAKR